MCYTIDGTLHRQIRQGKRQGASKDALNSLIDHYNKLSERGNQMPRLHYQVSGFAHPILPIMALPHTGATVQPMQWGLVPHWCKDAATAKQLAAQCLNARSETMASKPTFCTAAGRGVLAAGGFYEYHHFMGRAYPFHVHPADGQPLLIAVLWDEWANTTTGQVLQSFAIATIAGNALMATLHNNPKLDGPRMPLLLNIDTMEQWLTTPQVPPCNIDLRAHAVRALVGNRATGNTPEAALPFDYPELAFDTALMEVLGA